MTAPFIAALLQHDGLDSRGADKMQVKIEREHSRLHRAAFLAPLKSAFIATTGKMFTAGHYVDMWTRRLEKDCGKALFFHCLLPPFQRGSVVAPQV